VQKLAEGRAPPRRRGLLTRVAVRSRNEVGVLADAFNQMGDEIQKAIEEIGAGRGEQGALHGLHSACWPTPSTRRTPTPAALRAGRLLLGLRGEALGMTAEDVERVHLSGIIHDVGKIGIEDKIPAQGGRPHRRGVRDHEAAPDQRASTSSKRFRC